MSELKETKKMKVFQPYLTKKKPLGPKKVKNDPKIERRFKVRIEEKLGK